MGVETRVLGARSSRSSPVLLVGAVALLLLWLVARPANALCNEADRAALLDLRASLNNTSVLSSWTNNTDCCETWPYMECDNGGRVTVVDIRSSNALNGTISPSIGKLTYLRRLVFRKLPLLVGPIPSEICKLRQLVELTLERNSLNGSIPSCIGRLYNLNYLSLSQNKFTGNIPSSIGGLYNLDALYLDSNNFTGAIPSSFEEGLDLERTNLSFNKFSGDASPLFGWWKRTKTIDISTNSFSFDLSTVTFPEGLEIFNMSVNSVSGSIPDNADDLKNLTQFDVSHNKLSGEIPQGGVINKFDVSAFEYNDGLCGSPLPPCNSLVHQHRLIRPSYQGHRVEASH